MEKKVLIVDYGSQSAKKIEKMYQAHQNNSEAEYSIDVKTEPEIKKIKPDELANYHIVHHSGSMKRKLSDETTNYIMENTKDAYHIGTCYGAQMLAKHHGVEAEKLDSHQKGKKEINTKNGKSHIHKNHSYGIPIGKNSELEEIASSEQKFQDGKKENIYEVFKADKHIGIQGHAEQGCGKEIMYDVLNKIYNGQY
jgi:GMP synthase-like glutamine amidotransferase